MIAVYMLCALVSILIAAFVLAPLTKSHALLARTYDGFADESELKNVIEIRDALVEKLVSGKSDHRVVNQLGAESSFDALVNVCLRLQKAGLKYLPIFLLSLVSFPKLLLALDVPESLQIDGRHIPRLHQFSLSAGDATLNVRYLGLFKNTAPGKKLEVLLPLPSNILDFKVAKQPNATVSSDANKNPILVLDQAPEFIEIQADFSIAASNGVAAWRNNHHAGLPGTALIMTSLYEGGLRNFLEMFVGSPNIWPMRIVNEPKDFTASTITNQFDPNEAKYDMLSKLPPQKSRHIIRMNDSSGPYPEFDVIGIVPSRTPIVSLATGFGLMIFASGLVVLTRPKRNA